MKLFHQHILEILGVTSGVHKFSNTKTIANTNTKYKVSEFWVGLVRCTCCTQQLFVTSRWMALGMTFVTGGDHFFPSDVVNSAIKEPPCASFSFWRPPPPPSDGLWPFRACSPSVSVKSVFLATEPLCHRWAIASDKIWFWGKAQKMKISQLPENLLTRIRPSSCGRLICSM